MGRRAVEAGARGGPYAFLTPPEQHDPFTTAKLENLLIGGAVEIHRALEPFRADGEAYPAGTDIIFLAQPYRAYVKTLLERQSYAGHRATANGPADRPYDVAGWTLPKQMGVNVLIVERSSESPPTSRLTTAAIAPANVWGERKPGYWVIEANGNGGAVAINRLVAAGASPAGAAIPNKKSGFPYQTGADVAPSV